MSLTQKDLIDTITQRAPASTARLSKNTSRCCAQPLSIVTARTLKAGGDALPSKRLSKASQRARAHRP
ncbi:hypothetical protein [Ectopseudomonas oleovorans]|uniref:hypothetical protein n=1 Tax=Ectopseudomonas oleovorans TaxID=301 RepID=UPI003F1DEA43